MKNQNWSDIPKEGPGLPQAQQRFRSQSTIDVPGGFRWWMGIWLVIMIVVFVWILGWGWGGSSKGWGGKRQFPVRPAVIAVQAGEKLSASRPISGYQ